MQRNTLKTNLSERNVTEESETETSLEDSKHVNWQFV